MKKVVINKCFGDFEVSDKIAIQIYKEENHLDKIFIYISQSLFDDEFRYLDLKYLIFNSDDNNIINRIFNKYDIYLSKEYLGEIINNKDELIPLEYLITGISRENKDLIHYIEELGSKKCSGNNAELKIVEIPDDVQYYIKNTDGIEVIHEIHRTWE